MTQRPSLKAFCGPMVLCLSQRASMDVLLCESFNSMMILVILHCKKNWTLTDETLGRGSFTEGASSCSCYGGQAREYVTRLKLVKGESCGE
mmetsp:Transcript_28389/g.67494  ORF Transcript_28389/g.67494 Transcript_28389/m.67494 type:complete len:91 (+) Transcript_28389:170-442(+)